MWKSSIFIILIFKLISCWGRIHEVVVENDVRKYVPLSEFSFYKGGKLNVQLLNFKVAPENEKALFGFSLVQSFYKGSLPISNDHHQCLLKTEPNVEDDQLAEIYFLMNLSDQRVNVKCNFGGSLVHIYKNDNEIPVGYPEQVLPKNEHILVQPRRRRNSDFVGSSNFMFINNYRSCEDIQLPFTKRIGSDGIPVYNTSFVMYVANDAEKGFHNLYFHSCPNYNQNNKVPFSFKVQIIEMNKSSFLSADEMPLPTLYCIMAVLLLVFEALWMLLMCKTQHPVYKLHYLIAAVVFLKVLSLSFNGINLHFIDMLGVPLTMWSVVYRITHFLKNILLYLTLALIGTGWKSIKHTLTLSDKCICVMVVALQVLKNSAEIILENEKGVHEGRFYHNISFVTDILCCIFILFLGARTMIRLRRANDENGKPVANRQKLKLFRHFYLMMVLYIYATRILVYLLLITVPFQYVWLSKLTIEAFTFILITFTGWKFRPAYNSHLAVGQADDAECLIQKLKTELNQNLQQPPVHL